MNGIHQVQSLIDGCRSIQVDNWNEREALKKLDLGRAFITLDFADIAVL